MKIAISGSTGLVGTHLTKIFQANAEEVVRLGRDLFAPSATEKLSAALEGCQVVINLAGATILHPWSKEYRQLMIDSRVGVTQSIVRAINRMEHKPSLFISTSAVGYYPDRGCYDEYSATQGDGFLAQLCAQWEAAAQEVSSEVRLVVTRFAMVLSPDGGAFAQMKKPLGMGISAIMGSGEQPFTWISIEDLGRAIEFVIANPDISGGVNLVAPDQSNYRDFARTAAQHYRSWASIRIPEWAMKLAMGESSSFIAQGQCVAPTRLLEAGFEFRSKTIKDFLQTL